MSKAAPRTLFAHVESFFTDYLPLQRMRAAITRRDAGRSSQL